MNQNRWRQLHETRLRLRDGKWRCQDWRFARHCSAHARHSRLRMHPAKIERVCHDEFADQRLNGEYFNITFAEACIELDNYADEIKAANIGISNISKQDDMIDDTTIKCNFRTSSERFQKEFDLKNNNPNAKTLFKLAKTFNVSADYLLGLTDDPRPVDEILATQNTQAPTPVSPSDIEKRFDELSAMLTEHNARLSALESAQVAQA